MAHPQFLHPFHHTLSGPCDVYVDPSYTGTGIVFHHLGTDAVDLFLLSAEKTKRTLDRFFSSATAIRDQFSTLLGSALHDGLVPTVYMEQPFPNGQTSAGLFGLQFLLLDVLRSRSVQTYGFTASMVARGIKRVFAPAKDGNTARKEIVSSLLQSHPVVYSREKLSWAGADIQTAYLFMHFIQKCPEVKVSLVDYGFSGGRRP